MATGGGISSGHQGIASPARDDGQVNVYGVKDCGAKNKCQSYPTIYPTLDRHVMAEYGNSWQEKTPLSSRETGFVKFRSYRNWWSWGDLNPRPQAFFEQIYMFSGLI